jgi:hypothetical protein
MRAMVAVKPWHLAVLLCGMLTCTTAVAAVVLLLAWRGRRR